MPHKHKRKAADDDAHFNLPPTIQAAPLSITPSRTSKKRKTAHISNYGADDTPKAFARLMTFSGGRRKQRSGLDDGLQPKKNSKKRNPAATAHDDEEAENAPQVDTESASETQSATQLKILPNESLWEFRQRVNQALPLSGISRSGKKTPGISDHRITKHERKLKRLQKGWREEEARIREKEEEARELAEEEENDAEDLWEDRTSDLQMGYTSMKGKKGKSKARRKLVVGEVDDGINDEWEQLRRKRQEKRGLHDVVQAPPEFKRVPREIFKVKEGAKVAVGNVPGRGGSLRKREELGVERQGIIETYRALMAAKRGT